MSENPKQDEINAQYSDAALETYGQEILAQTREKLDAQVNLKIAQQNLNQLAGEYNELDGKFNKLTKEHERLKQENERLRADYVRVSGMDPADDDND